MPLPPNNYLIRWAPRDPPPPGGVYATSEGLGAQIAAKALGPPPLEQNWTIVPVDGGRPDEYFITLAEFAGPRAGWNLGGEIPVHVPVILAVDRLARWIITPVDHENRIYRITDPTTLIGVVRAVAQDDNRLFVNTYVVGADLPQWQITPSGIVN